MKKISIIEKKQNRKKGIMQFACITLGIISIGLSACAQLQNNNCCGDSLHCLSCDKIPANVLITNLNTSMTSQYYQLEDGQLCTLPNDNQQMIGGRKHGK